MQQDDVRTALQHKLESILEKGIPHTPLGGVNLGALSKAVAAKGLSFYEGTIVTVGRSPSAYLVEFFDPSANHGYSSIWPEWAWDQAKLAFLTGKKALLCTNGDPLGDNLLSVIVLPSPATV